MQPSLKTPPSDETNWVYAKLIVIDGSRHLKPSEVAFDRLCFPQPPHLTSNRVEVILVNGDEEQRHTAIVLPHDSEAMRIPIRLDPQIAERQVADKIS